MYKKNNIGFKKVCLLFTLCSMLLAFFAVSVEAADKLVVKDSGRTTKFVVKEDGKVGIMTANPVGGLQTGGIRC